MIVKPKPGWNSILMGITLAAVVIGWFYNPVEYFMEAGPAAYYQARIAYERGADAERESIRHAVSDGKITMREYSDTVFPAYLRTIQTQETPFPIAEQSKSRDQLRGELQVATASRQ